MSARTNYIIAAVSAVAVLGATAGYVFLNNNDTPSTVAEDFTAEPATPATELADVSGDVEVAPAEIAPAVELEAVPVTELEPALDAGTTSETELEAITIDTDDVVTEEAVTDLPE